MKKLQGRSVLIVDDDDAARRAMARAFDSFGARVQQAATPEDGLVLANRTEGRLDLLVADVLLPSRSGIQLAQQVLDQRPGLPVLFVSGYADGGVVLEGVPAGQVGFLAKPMSIAELGRTAARLLGVTWDGDAAEA